MPAGRRWVSVLLGLAALGCRRPRAVPVTDAPTPTADAASLAVGVVALDGGTETLAVTADAGLRAEGAADVPRAPLRREGPWRRMAVVTPGPRDLVDRWTDAPDLDGDGFVDELVAIRWSVDTGCHPDDRGCPDLDEDDLHGSPTDGPAVLAYLARFSGDPALREAPDGGAGPNPATGRLLSLRRVWQRTGAPPTARLEGVHFSEFGPAVMARATLRLDDLAGATDTLDVVDLFVGPALDRRAGALVHHCVRDDDGAARVGALAVQIPSLAPLVWRAATGGPFTGCPTPTAALEASMAEPLAGGVTLEVLEDREIGVQGRVGLVPRGEGFDVAVTLPSTHRSRRGRPGQPPEGPTESPVDAGTPEDPLVRGPMRVLDVTRACAEDRVRYLAGTRRCELRVPRDDGAFGGCAAGASPLDPAPPRALAVLPGDPSVGDDPEGEAAPFRLLLARGTRLYGVPLPDCATGRRRGSARPWVGAVPRGLAASPGGRRALAGIGFDLWMGDPGRSVALLLNPPGGSLPRGTVRALGFETDDTFAAVISAHFVRVRVTLPVLPRTVPDGLVIDPSELRRGYRVR